MKILLITVAVLVFLSGIIFSKAYTFKKSEGLNELLPKKQEVMGDKDEEEESVSQPANTTTATLTTTPEKQVVGIIFSYKYPWDWTPAKVFGHRQNVFAPLF